MCENRDKLRFNRENDGYLKMSGINFQTIPQKNRGKMNNALKTLTKIEGKVGKLSAQQDI